MPKLTIIIPTFNSGETIVACLESIRRQTFSDYEVLIQDALSKDGTAAVTNDFAASNPQMNIRLARERDQGVYDAMNKAMERATGEWVYFLGSDDELYDVDGLSKMLGSPESLDGDVLYGNVKMVKADQTVQEAPIYDGPFDLKKLLQKNICHQAIVYRRAFMQQAGPYNIRYRVFADWDYNLRCWSRTRFRYVDVITATFHLGGLSTTNDDPAFDSEIGSKVMRYFGLSMLHPALNSRAFPGWRGIANLQRSRSLVHYAAGNGLRLTARVAGRVKRLFR